MSAHVVTNRTVFTYEPDGWPAGVITAYETTGGVLHLEHVIVLPGAPVTTLLRMVRVGIDEAARRGYSRMMFEVPRAYPYAAGLATLARRVGFVQQDPSVLHFERKL